MVTSPHSLPASPTALPLQGRHLAVAVCGGVAAYKAYDLIRALQQEGATVTALITPDAQAFISPLTLQALTHRPVITEALSVDDAGVPWHIALAQQADALIIVPATANTLAQLAHGLADNAVTTTAISWTGKPLVLIPAMNTRMWHHPLTQRNAAILQSLEHVTWVPPAWGELACGETGMGHLAPLATQMTWIHRALTLASQPPSHHYSGIRALVTAGGTLEQLDPVRVLTNRSSGKMGVALADALFAYGAEVTLIATETVTLPDLHQRPYSLIRVSTSQQLHDALNQQLPQTDVLWMTAAVSDFVPAHQAAQKIKRGQEPFDLALIPNTDLLATAVAQHPHVYAIGFAAETHDVEHFAQNKLARKQLQALCVNDVSRQDIGFGADDNEMTLFTATGLCVHLPKAPKTQMARTLVNQLATGIQAFVHARSASSSHAQNKTPQAV
ncbi:MAG: bifunctional phosphopantothenoylcysteine decarboxylase/phosphopantothenate--cysteine ligase CoaBC [Vampirovibrionales bacterium]